MKQPELAKRLGIPKDTFRGMLAPSSRATIEDGLLDSIADICGVPRWFMEYGFNPPAARGLEGAVREIVLRMIDEERKGRREAS